MPPANTTNIQVCRHPLAQQLLTRLRDYQTPCREFRRHALQLSNFLIYETLTCLNTRPIGVETPTGKASGAALTDYVIFVPILRAGLIMSEAALNLVPDARVYHIGLKRDEQTLKPSTYYNRLPKSLPADSRVFVLDPMLATGGSICAALSFFKDRNIIDAQVVCLVAAPEGVRSVHSLFPSVKIVTASIDDHLNEHGYIVPGLGDAGDRLFGT